MRPLSFSVPRAAQAGAPLVLAALVAGCAHGPMGGSAAAPQDMAVPATASDAQLDTMFLTRAMQSDMLEIAASRLAVQKSTNAQVQQFARQMINDHTTNGQQLRQLALARGVTSAPSPLPADEVKFEQLRNAEGVVFDRTYATTIAVAAHTEAVTLYEQQASQGSDEALRSFAAQKLPTLRHHLEMGEALAASLR